MADLLGSLRSVFGAFLGALAMLFLADTAGAATFTVDRTTTGGDITIDGVCDADASVDTDCSLAAAVEEANATVASDTIVFKKGSVAGGDADDESFSPSASAMMINAPPPAITGPTIIDGGDCDSDPDAGAPCVSVASGWEIDASGEVQIRGLAFNGNGATIGIRVIEVNGTIANQPDFLMFGNWFGIDRNGVVGPNNLGAAAVQLEDVDGARIGSGFPADRNLFARHEIGIDILGADNTLVGGNWFGVDPDGTFSRSGEFTRSNGDSIEITSNAAPNPDDQSTGTVIGSSDAGQAATPECDGGCNVLAGAGASDEGNDNPNADAIDLVGEGGDEIPASDVLIVGNDIGESVMLNRRAIDIGNADDVTIGGPAAGDADRNLIDRGEIVSGAGSTGLLIENNSIGAPLGAATPTLDLQGTGQALDNFIGAQGGSPAINLSNTTGAAYTVQGNLIGEGADGSFLNPGAIGIEIDAGSNGNLVGGEAAGDGNLIGGFPLVAVGNPMGVRIEGDDNDVLGNTLGEASDGTPRRLSRGIVLQTDADGNLIGGDTAGSENSISNVDKANLATGGNAIEVLGADSDGNRILRNRGGDNQFLFLDLGADGAGNLAEPNGPNGGIQAPAIATATTVGASGTATPGATVRVFTKASASPGELEGFLAQATADGSGAWTMTYPAQATGDLVAATATTGTGTSELSATATLTDPPDPPDTDPPETTITKSPKNVIKLKGKKKRAKARYTFAADEAGSTFACTVDAKPAKPCTSPLKLKRLKKGRHTVSIVATDVAGNADPTAATDSFKVKRKRKR